MTQATEEHWFLPTTKTELPVGTRLRWINKRDNVVIERTLLTPGRIVPNPFCATWGATGIVMGSGREPLRYLENGFNAGRGSINAHHVLLPATKDQKWLKPWTEMWLPTGTRIKHAARVVQLYTEVKLEQTASGVWIAQAVDGEHLVHATEHGMAVSSGGFFVEEFLLPEEAAKSGETYVPAHLFAEGQTWRSTRTGCVITLEEFDGRLWLCTGEHGGCGGVAEHVLREEFEWVSDPEPTERPLAVGQVWRTSTRHGPNDEHIRVIIKNVSDAGLSLQWPKGHCLDEKIDEFRERFTWVSDGEHQESPPCVHHAKPATGQEPQPDAYVLAEQRLRARLISEYPNFLEHLEVASTSALDSLLFLQPSDPGAQQKLSDGLASEHPSPARVRPRPHEGRSDRVLKQPVRQARRWER